MAGGGAGRPGGRCKEGGLLTQDRDQGRAASHTVQTHSENTKKHKDVSLTIRDPGWVGVVVNGLSAESVGCLQIKFQVRQLHICGILSVGGRKREIVALPTL